MAATKRRLVSLLAMATSLCFLVACTVLDTGKTPPLAWRAFWGTGQFHALSPSTLNTPGEPQSDLLGQTFLTIGFDNRLHALDPATGNERWSYGPTGDAVIHFYVDGERLLVHVAVPNLAHKTTDTYFAELNPTDGSEIWRLDAPIDVFRSGVVFMNDRVYAAGQDHISFEDSLARRRKGDVAFHPRLVALDRSGVLWQSPLRPITDSGSIIFGARTVAAGQTIVVRSDRDSVSQIEAFDASDGTRLWGREAEGQASPQRMLAWRDRVVLIQKQGVQIIDGRDGQTLQQGSSEQLIGGFDLLQSAVDGDGLYVYSEGTEQDPLRRIDLTNLTVSWARTFHADSPAAFIEPGQLYDARPFSFSSGVVYFGARDAYVYGLDERSGKVVKKFFLAQGGTIPFVPPFHYSQLTIVTDLYVLAYRA